MWYKSKGFGDINKIYAETFELIKKYRKGYYKNKVKNLPSRESLLKIPKEIKSEFEKELLNLLKLAIRNIAILRNFKKDKPNFSSYSGELNKKHLYIQLLFIFQG